jgi:hypothetical protein
MNRIYLYLIAFMVLTALIAGCSNKSNDNANPVALNINDYPSTPAVSVEQTNRMLCGLYQVDFNVQNLTANTMINRAALGHYNIVDFIMEPLITINSYDPVSEIVDVDLTIINTHSIDGYDIRLIIFTDSAGHKLLNADDWTGLHDIPGGLPINPFIAYNKDKPNRIFAGETLRKENLQILLPGGNPSVSFAIDASFPTNCEEPYEISGFTMGALNDYTNAYAKAEVIVKSWAGAVNSVDLYCPQVTDETLTTFEYEANDKWVAYIVNRNNVPVGEYTGYMLASTDVSGSLLLYDEIIISVTHEVRWARTWGGQQNDIAMNIALDNSGNSYVTGFFITSADFDPGPDEIIKESNRYEDIFLCKYDSEGLLQWVHTWGSSSHDSERGIGIACDGSDSLYIIGHFRGTCDFDPGVEVDEHISNGDRDAFLCKFDTDGNYQWAGTWGSEEDYDWAYQLVLDNSQNISVVGMFSDTVDFDPGPDEEIKSSTGWLDAYLSHFDSDGNFQWVLTWGGISADKALGIDVDLMGNIYATGYFNETVDFDPGPGQDYRDAQGAGINDSDIYLSKYAPDGDYLWALTFGGNDSSAGYAVHCLSSQRIYVCGEFRGTVDFDPGPLVDEYSDEGCFLSRFDNAGGYYWTRTWGADDAGILATDQTGKLYVFGSFHNRVDFDPSISVDEREAGSSNPYISMFDYDGNYLDVITFGGNSLTYAFGLAIDSDRNILVSGGFYSSVDFDISLGEDIHTSNGDADAYLSKIVY